MRKIAVFIVAVLLVTMSFGLMVSYSDSDRDYFMSNFDVDATVDSYGNMQVEETITYNFHGHFNGVYRTLYNTGSLGYEDIHVYKYDETGALKEFEFNDSENENTYEKLEVDNGIKLKIFSQATDEKKTFVIRYKVLGAAVKYNDAGVLYWKFMGEDTDVVINSFDVKIHIPAGADINDFKVFAHSSQLSGGIQKLDAQTALISAETLEPHSFVEARLLFPAKLIENSQRIEKQDVAQSIMAEEKKWADEANRKRTVARIFVFGSFVIALLELLLIVFLYFKYDKEYSSTFYGEYYRELPGEYSPAELSYLWNFGRIYPRDITATIMDMVRKKYLKLNTETREVRGLIKSRNETSYSFELNEEANLHGLKKHEKYLIDWLIGTIGDGKKVYLTDIEHSAKTRSAAQEFKADYDAWVEYVKLEAENYNFLDKSTLKGTLIGIGVAVLGILYAVYTAVAHENIPGLVLLIITSVLLIIYSASIKRRSKTGVEDYKKWKAFRKFLKDFSHLDKANMPSIILWEHFLVYAITLGVAKEVIKQLKLVFREEDFNNAGLTYMYYGHYGHMYGHLDAIDHVTSTLISTTESTYSQAMSQLSSGSGGGGGFSGGGGGGGGGGGAGAF